MNSVTDFWHVSKPLLFSCVTTAFITAGSVHAEVNSEAIERFVDDSVWAVLCCDFSRWASLESDNALLGIARIRHPWQEEKRKRLEKNLKALPPVLDGMGIEAGWMLLSPDDAIRRGGFPILFPVKEGGDHSEVQRMARNIAISAGEARDEGGQQVPTNRTSQWIDESRVVISGTNQVVEHYLDVKSESRQDLFGPLKELMSGGAIVAVVLSPDWHSRRAIRELWPPDAPSPFDSINGSMIADDVRWIGFELRAKPQPLGRLIIELDNVAIAQQFHTWIRQKLKWVAKQPAPNGQSGDPNLIGLVNTLQPQRVGKRIILEFDSSGNQVSALYALVAPAMNAASGAAGTSERQNNSNGE